jgi:hypothetical protein
MRPRPSTLAELRRDALTAALMLPAVTVAAFVFAAMF